MNALTTAFSQLVTGKDNQTHDLVKWAGLITILHVWGMSIYQVVYLNQAFDPQQFATTMATVLVSVSASLKVKETTEPDKTDTTDTSTQGVSK